MPYTIRSRKEILSDFIAKLRRDGNEDLVKLLRGKREMAGISAIADEVGFTEYPKKGESIKDYLNKLQPYIDKWRG